MTTQPDHALQRNPYPDVLTAVKLSGRDKYNVERHLDEFEQATHTTAS